MDEPDSNITTYTHHPGIVTDETSLQDNLPLLLSQPGVAGDEGGGKHPQPGPRDGGRTQFHVPGRQRLVRTQRHTPLNLTESKYH